MEMVYGFQFSFHSFCIGYHMEVCLPFFKTMHGVGSMVIFSGQYVVVDGLYVSVVDRRWVGGGGGGGGSKIDFSMTGQDAILPAN
jgi:hypothetical protein